MSINSRYAAPAAIDRYQLPAPSSAANSLNIADAVERRDRQTDVHSTTFYDAYRIQCGPLTCYLYRITYHWCGPRNCERHLVLCWPIENVEFFLQASVLSKTQLSTDWTIQVGRLTKTPYCWWWLYCTRSRVYKTARCLSQHGHTPTTANPMLQVWLIAAVAACESGQCHVVSVCT